MDNLPLPQSDHDIVVTMAATTKLGIADLKTDIADLKTIIAELKGSFNIQYASLDSRLKMIEGITTQANPIESVKLLREHDEFIKDYKSTHKERNAIIAMVMGSIATLVSILTLATKFTGKN